MHEEKHIVFSLIFEQNLKKSSSGKMCVLYTPLTGYIQSTPLHENPEVPDFFLFASFILLFLRILSEKVHAVFQKRQRVSLLRSRNALAGAS